MVRLRRALAVLFVLAAAAGAGLAWWSAQPAPAPTSPAQPSEDPLEAQPGSSAKAATRQSAPFDGGFARKTPPSVTEGHATPLASDATAVADPSTVPSKPDVSGPEVDTGSQQASTPSPSEGPHLKAWPPELRVKEGPLVPEAVAAVARKEAVAALYRSGQKPVFVNAQGLTALGRVAHRWVAEARYHHLTAVAAAYERHIVERQPLAPAELEAALADQLAFLTANMRPVPRTEALLENSKTGAYVSPDILWQGNAPFEPTEGLVRNLFAATADAASLEDYLRGLEPPHPQYRKLIDAARHYDQQVCPRGTWETLAVPKKSLAKTWSQPERISRLQRRLALEGFFEGTPTGVFDPATEEGLKAFQRRNNLKPVGRFNRPTAKTLNIPCKRRVRVLALNAHRWRHSALTPKETTYVHVNIPGFALTYMRDGALRATRRVIVGKGHSWYSPAKKRRIYRNATPVLSDVIQTIIFNPTWTVPTRAVLNEIKPAIERDPEYLKKNGFVVRKRADGRDSYVQMPGTNNALGDVKFYFPNAESIYLHDTNRRGLFVRARRDFSHGCVRVHKAVEFATEVLKDDLVAKGETYKGGLKTLAARNNTVRFALHRPVPVFLEYFTATVGDDGTVVFHPDIYDYDYAALIKPIGKQLPVWPPGT